MGIYNKLLVPLDGSKLGEASLPFAKELVAKTLSSWGIQPNVVGQAKA